MPIGLTACLMVLGLASAPPAAAQLRLPAAPVPLPKRLPVPDLESTSRRAEAIVAPLDQLDLRPAIIQELLRHRDRIDADAHGQPVVRGEVVALSLSPSMRQAALVAGFAVTREHSLAGLDVTVVVLRAPSGVSTAQALQRLHTLDPTGTYDFNHLYLGGGAVRDSGATVTAATTAIAPAAPATTQAAAPRVGQIDAGIDARHPALRGAELQRHGCGGAAMPTAHGTAVASLLVGRARGFAGAAPGAVLYAADVFCNELTGGAIDAIAEAFGWMAQQQVPVINVSLVGPANDALAHVVAALIARGHLIVAAVGNDGPAAPPLYPASYPGVVGVTAVDARNQALPEAARGPQVVFAAPGADLAVAANGTLGYTAARGTSFAAPIVAGLLATIGPPDDVSSSVARLARDCVDLGPPGRDSTYGYGLVGARVRVDPASLASASPLLGRSDAGVR